jgi:hypothetical protein
MFSSDGYGRCATLSGLARCGRLPKAGRPRWGTACLGLCCIAPLGHRGLNEAAVGVVILEACSCPFPVNCNAGVFLEGSLRGNDAALVVLGEGGKAQRQLFTGSEPSAEAGGEPEAGPGVWRIDVHGCRSSLVATPFWMTASAYSAPKGAWMGGVLTGETL